MIVSDNTIQFGGLTVFVSTLSNRRFKVSKKMAKKVLKILEEPWK